MENKPQALHGHKVLLLKICHLNLVPFHSIEVLSDMMAWPGNSKHCDHMASVKSSFIYFISLCLSKATILVIYYLSV